MAQRYRLIGANGSPYSVKLRAIMRYRRLPFDWVIRTRAVLPEIAHIKPLLVPILQYPEDGSYHLDSTPLAYALEERHPGTRSIMPDDSGHAFLSHLLEDMADEWATKIMFFYRWDRPVDQDYCSRWLAGESQVPAGDAEIEALAKQFRDRQVGRMALVGCDAKNAPLITESFRRILDLLEAYLRSGRYLFGSRPALADFGWFGQLSQLATDPTPMGIMRNTAPRTYQWVWRLDDASGVDGDWLAPTASLPEATLGLLRLCGEIHLPFLKANAAAVAAGREGFSFQACGHTHAQGVFRYQVKCLDWLRQEFDALTGPARKRTEAILAETGCLPALLS